MTNWLKLKIGYLLRVTVLSGRYAGQYRSRLEEQDWTRLWIAVPLLGADEVPIFPQSEVEISYILTTDNGAGNYSFRAPVLAVQRIPVRCLVVPVPEKVVKTQLRQFVRMKCDFEVQVRLLRDAEGSSPAAPRVESQEAFVARVRDISGGGLLLGDVPADLDDGVSLELRLFLPKSDIPETVVGRVARTLTDEEGRKSYGIEFTAIRETTRENIIRYVYERQRELRKRGAL